MAETLVVGSKTSYSEPIGTGGNREDLSDILYDVSPTETPFVTMASKSESATAVNHEWLTDKLGDPAKNAHIEGAVASAVKPAGRARLGNYTQIFQKHAVVTGTQEKVLKGGGIKSEMAYQVARRMKEIKRDLEFACIGSGHQVKKAGAEDTAREMGSFQSFMGDDSVMLGATGAAGNGDGSDIYTAGTARDFTEDLLTAALEKMWNQSGGSESISALMGSHQRKLFSGFSSASTRFVTVDDRKLTASIDVYDGDFHTVTAVPDRYVHTGEVLLIDPDYIGICDLRPLGTEDLAKNGDAQTKQLLMETTLKVGNPLAHMVIAGLTTS